MTRRHGAARVPRLGARGCRAHHDRGPRARCMDQRRRSNEAVFGYAMVLGGFGAPLFLFLAGVAVALSGESKFRKTGDFAGSWWAVQKRGWQIFGLAFLFRLQSYILSGGYQRNQPVESRHSQCDGPRHCPRGADGANQPEQGDARSALCGGRRGDISRCPRRPGDSSAGLASGPGGVVLQAVARADELHAVPVGRFRVRGSCGR